MNKVIFVGRLTCDPEVRYSQTENGSMAIARYTLAVDRGRKDNNGNSIADLAKDIGQLELIAKVRTIALE